MMSIHRLAAICIILLSAWVTGADITGEDASASEAEVSDFVPPLLEPASYLIRDSAVRQELRLTAEQTDSLQDLCDLMDEHLFALRDEPPQPTEPVSIRHIRAIETTMETLPTILSPRQRRRLEELSLQYEGATALFRPEPAEHLQLGPEQQLQMQMLYRESLRMQEELRQRLQETGEEAQLPQQIQQIQIHLARELLEVLTESQRVLWQTMLGPPFDFTQTRPLSFRAPDLQEVTEWIHTKPLSMRGLRGRVVVVHFWTFGCGNCRQNYPVYKLWARQYDPKEVLVLGIHTPETEGERDRAALRKKIEEEGLTFPVAVDNKKANWQAWSNRIWPSVYLVDKNGRVRYWWYGELRWQGATGDQWLSERIEELRSESPEAEAGRDNKAARQAR